MKTNEPRYCTKEEKEEEENKRTDSKGTKIVQGLKNHHITFSNELVHVNEVENWKEFNVVMEEETACEKCFRKTLECCQSY